VFLAWWDPFSLFVPKKGNVDLEEQQQEFSIPGRQTIEPTFQNFTSCNFLF